MAQGKRKRPQSSPSTRPESTHASTRRPSAARPRTPRRCAGKIVKVVLGLSCPSIERHDVILALYVATKSFLRDFRGMSDHLGPHDRGILKVLTRLNPHAVCDDHAIERRSGTDRHVV